MMVGLRARSYFRFGGPVNWSVAVLLAILAPIVYVTEPAGIPSWVSLALLAPFVVLAIWRAERTDSWLGGDGSGMAGPGDGC
jgi:hypothetical protein